MTEVKPVRPWKLKFVGNNVSFYKETEYHGKVPPETVALDLKETEVVKVKEELRDYDKPIPFKLLYSYLVEDERHVEKGEAVYGEVSGDWCEQLKKSIAVPAGGVLKVNG
jgi:hypothetical protein